MGVVMIRHLLALTDAQLLALTIASSPLEPAARSKFLLEVGRRCPINDQQLVDAVSASLAAIGYDSTGGKLIKASKLPKFGNSDDHQTQENDHASHP
jgi:hypothetical protein